MRKLIEALNNASSMPLPPKALERSFDRCWPDLEREISNVPLEDHDSREESRSPEDKTDEILSRLRSLDKELAALSTNIETAAHSARLENPRDRGTLPAGTSAIESSAENLINGMLDYLETEGVGGFGLDHRESHLLELLHALGSSLSPSQRARLGYVIAKTATSSDLKKIAEKVRDGES